MSRVVCPDAVWPDENYLVCSTTIYGEELIHQSEKSDDRADHSVAVLNEHERINARRERFYWRELKPGEEIARGRKHYLA